MKISSSVLAVLACGVRLCLARDEHKTEECTITHPVTGEFYDLRGLARHPDEENAVDWHVHGYDYAGGNFSINICAPLITKTSRVSTTGNISAIYTNEDEKMYSIGRTSTQLRFRGKKLILEYTGGSQCPGDTTYTKSSLILFTCDPSMIGTASVGFIGEMNECAYFFEYKTSRACATTRDVESALSPGYVFLIILIVALGVYFVGGCMYSRTVLHQRGWRQVPNYELWNGLAGFLGDLATIVFVTVLERVKDVLAILGIKKRKAQNGFSDSYGGRSDSYSRVDHDNQLIDDIEDDRW